MQWITDGESNAPVNLEHVTTFDVSNNTIVFKLASGAAPVIWVYEDQESARRAYLPILRSISID